MIGWAAPLRARRSPADAPTARLRRPRGAAVSRRTHGEGPDHLLMGLHAR